MTSLIANFYFILGGGATERDITTTASSLQSTSELKRSRSFVKDFVHIDLKPQYKIVLGRQDERKEADDINVPPERKEMIDVPAESSFVLTEGYEMHLTAQDSDDVDSDLSILSSQPSSLNYQLCDSYPNKDVNQVVTPIDEEDKVVCIPSVEEGHQEVTDMQVVTTVPVECEDKCMKYVVVPPSSKMGKESINDLK